MANYYNKDLYKVLDVSFDASNEEIKASYRKLVRQYHPDVSKNPNDAIKFKEIQEAYEILIDEEARKKFWNNYPTHLFVGKIFTNVLI